MSASSNGFDPEMMRSVHLRAVSLCPCLSVCLSACLPAIDVYLMSEYVIRWECTNTGSAQVAWADEIILTKQKMN